MMRELQRIALKPGQVPDEFMCPDEKGVRNGTSFLAAMKRVLRRRRPLLGSF